MLARSSRCHLVSTFPRNGSVVAAPPDFLQVLFDRPIRAVSARLTDCDGNAVPCVVEEHGERLVIVPGGPFKRQCSILAVWRVLLQEGKEESGAFSFQVGVPSYRGTSTSLVTEPAVRAVLESTRPGLTSLSLAVAAARGKVWWTHSHVPETLTWEAQRVRGAMVARGVLPLPGEWSMYARLTKRDGSMIEIGSSAVIDPGRVLGGEIPQGAVGQP